MLNKIIKIIIYLAIFLMPIFFLPVTMFPLMLNKQILLLFLASLALILWLIMIIKQGRLNLKWSRLSTVILILLFVLGVSTVFSSARSYSFWSAIASQSCLNFILYIIIFFLVSNVFDKNKDIIKALVILLISATLLNLLFLSQLFFGSVLPWDFSQAVGFNLMGSIWTLAVFLGGMTIMLLALSGEAKIFKNKFYKLFGYLALGLFFIGLIIIDFKPVWLALALSAIIIIWQKLKDFPLTKENDPLESNLTGVSEAESDPVKSSIAGPPGAEFDRVKKIDLKTVYLPAIIFVMAVIFIVIKPPLPERLQLPNLITLNNQSTRAIISDTLNDSFKNIVIGSGPATFEYQYALHRPQGIVQGPFWQTRFNQGKYALATFLTEFGILGLAGFLLIILFFLWQGVKTIILSKKVNRSFKTQVNIQSAIFATGFYFLLTWFLYSADFPLLFITFLILGLWSALRPESNKADNVKEIIFTKSPQLAFFIMLISIIIIPALAIGLFYSGKKYVGAINYSQALSAIRKKDAPINLAIDFLIKAVNQDATNDLYLRDLSEAYLIKLSQLESNAQLSAEQKKQEAQSLINKLELLVQKMIVVNPKNSQNFEQAGRIYASLMAIDPNVYQLAMNNYLKASELDPKNPLVLLKLSSLNFEMAKSAFNESEQPGVKQEDKDKILDFYNQTLKTSLEYADKTIKLKNNYVSAYYLRAMIYDFSKQYELALANYQVVLQVEPSNKEVLKRAQEIAEILKNNIKK